MIQDFEDVRVYDLHKEALARKKQCRKGSEGYAAWGLLVSVNCPQFTLENVREIVEYWVEHGKIHPTRRKIFKDWLQGTKRYTR